MFYKDQFTPADLDRGYELVRFCMQYEIPIELDKIDDPALIADLYIIKWKEFTKHETK